MTHPPPPSQYEVAVAVPPPHVATAQTNVVPFAGPHAATLEPSQVAAQFPPAPMQGEREPRGCPPITSVHVPIDDAMLHAWHWPVQVELQHTPSTQLLAPPGHSLAVAALQAVPNGRWHAPLTPDTLHFKPVAQGPSVQQTPSAHVSPSPG